MSDAATARLIFDRLDKTAAPWYMSPTLWGSGLGAIGGGLIGGLPGAAAGSALGGGAGFAAAMPGLTKALKPVGELAFSTAKAAPGMTTLAIGMPIAFGGMGMMGDPEEKARRKVERRQLASQIGHPMPKYSSAIGSEEDLKRALSIRSSLEKQAAVKGEAAKTFAEHLLKNPFEAGVLAATVTAASMATQAVGSSGGVVAHKAMNQTRLVNREKQYKKMLKADPSLKQEPMSRTFFNTLHKASPYIAKEPFVAAATVRSMLETPSASFGGPPMVSPKQLKELLETEKARQETEFPLFRKGMPSAGSMPSGIYPE
jgi:hypothetical protein